MAQPRTHLLARLRAPALLALVGLLASGCAAWRPVSRQDAWTLYARKGTEVDVARIETSLAPAFAAVEQRMGPFERRVRVHTWREGDEVRRDAGGKLPGDERGQMQDVPGIGPARVRAFHVRGGANFFSPSGVFLGTTEVGTAVHELVHARLAELAEDVPLWFEEGLASYLGDGIRYGDGWVFDGLACWPLRELRSQRLDDAELEALLALSPRDDYGSRENLLVHFLGWAIVFDLAREAPDAPWQDWLAAYRAGTERDGAVRHARARLERTLDPATEDAWLERLADPRPGVRLAAAKGLWKLRSVEAVDRLLEALERERDPEVRYGMALNALLARAEMRLDRGRWRRLASLVFPTLREPLLEDPAEQAAAHDLYASVRWRSGRRPSSQQAFDRLARFWEE